MARKSKQDETIKAKLLALLQQFPGTIADNIPMNQRRFLRSLEKEGNLEARKDGDDYRWFIKRQEPTRTQEEPPTPEPKTIADQLQDLFMDKFSEDWRRDISLTLRADHLYWLVFLAERGIEERRQYFKTSTMTRPAEAAASLGSWTMDLENLLNRVKSTFPPKKGG